MDSEQFAQFLYAQQAQQEQITQILKLLIPRLRSEDKLGSTSKCVTSASSSKKSLDKMHI